MNPLKTIRDEYERKARLYPGLLVISPIMATSFAIFSPHISLIRLLVVGAMGGGGPFLLTQLTRDLGKKKEKELYSKWGGMPSMAIFRYRDRRLDPITKERYRKKLSTLVKEVKAPTVEEEKANPSAADEVYLAWSNFLRTNTRDQRKFSLLFKENLNYGYRRNVLGLRSIGIAMCLLSGLICGFLIYRIYMSTGKIDKPLAGGGIFSLVFLTLWVIRFKENWVKVSADAYAERLAECTETFTIKSSTKKN